MRDAKRSISIKGGGDVPGGRFENLRIYGAGEIHGDIEADGLRVWGAGSIDGATHAKSVRIVGSGSFGEDLDVDRVSVLGASSVQGAIRARQLKCVGHARIDSSIEADEIRVTGHLECAKSVVAESIHIRGSASIKGLLSADQTEIHLGGPSQCDEIGGERIRVYRRSLGEGSRVLSAVDRLFGSNRTDRRLTANLIEGDDLRLENTIATVVRGRHVAIGEGCRIRRVEYRDTIEVHPDAAVESLVRLSGSHGETVPQPLAS